MLLSENVHDKLVDFVGVGGEAESDAVGSVVNDTLLDVVLVIVTERLRSLLTLVVCDSDTDRVGSLETVSDPVSDAVELGVSVPVLEKDRVISDDAVAVREGFVTVIETSNDADLVPEIESLSDLYIVKVLDSECEIDWDTESDDSSDSEIDFDGERLGRLFELESLELLDWDLERVISDVGVFDRLRLADWLTLCVFGKDTV